MSGLRIKKWQLLLRKQWQAITTFNSSDRRWQLPFTAALASGLPMLLAAMLGHIEFGLAAALGGMVFLHINKSPLSQRMVRLMVCAFGMIACYTVGVFSQFIPLIVIPIIIATTIVVAMIMRFYDLGPPGALFFVMALSIGAYTPIPFDKAPGMIGLLSLGCIFAVLLAESANINAGGNVNDIAWARFYDTLLGCAIGLIGALCIYQKALRGRLMPLLQKLIPDYFALPNPAQASPSTAPKPPAK